MKTLGALTITAAAVLFALASCRRPQPASVEAADPADIKTLDPVFRVPGFENKLALNVGLPGKNDIAEFVDYDLGTCFPATGFLGAMEQHLLGLGWSPAEYTFSVPPTPTVESSRWRQSAREGDPAWWFETWWLHDQEVLWVTGRGLPENAQHPKAGMARVTVLRYRKDYAGGLLKEHRAHVAALRTSESERQVQEAAWGAVGDDP